MAKKLAISEEAIFKQIEHSKYPIVMVDKLILNSQQHTGLQSVHIKEETLEDASVEKENLLEGGYEYIKFPQGGNDTNCSNLSNPWPLVVRPSKVNKGDNGVWASADLSKGVLFGPYEKRVLNYEEQRKKSGCGLRIGKHVSPVKCIDATDSCISDWLCLINHSKSYDKSNLEAFDVEGDIYYKTMTNIKRGTELIVWYGDDLGRRLDEEEHHVRKQEELIPRSMQSIPSKIPGTKKKSLRGNNFYHTREKSFQCAHCETRFHSKSILISHIQIHTGTKKEKPFQCSHCEKRFYTKASLIIHIRIHTGEKPFQCSYCEKRFGYKSALKRHIPIHTGTKKEKSFQCSHCQKIFRDKSNLRRHISIHTGELPFQCSHCEKRFSTKSVLITHLKIHTGEKPIQCSYCEKRFCTKTYLRCHIRTHTGEKPFKCSYCSFATSRKDTLVYHSITHTGIKPFQCSHCDKRFGDKRALKQHNQIHSVETFQCLHCQKRFSYKSNLIEHIRIHTGEKPFECSHCEYRCSHKSTLRHHNQIHTGHKKRFYNKSSLISHIRTHTKGTRMQSSCPRLDPAGGLLINKKFINNREKPFKCSYCSFAASRKDTLVYHSITHTGIKPFQCSHCEKRFGDKRSLNRHNKIHSVKKFLCAHCEKRFSYKFHLIEHIRIHTGEKPFECSHCEFRCSRKSTLIRHHNQIHNNAC